MDQRTATSVLQTLDAAVALADPATWEIVFENARFFEWYPPPGEVDAPLTARLPDLDADRLRERVSAGRRFEWDGTVGTGARAKTVRGRARRCDVDGRELVVLECSDVTKEREAEYLLDSYSKMVERNTRDLQREKERVEKLLLNIMPRAVYEEMKDFGSTTPQRFDDASILLLDFVGFTDMAVARDPSTLITELNDIFTAFDRIVELFNCERMKTIGDAYMAVSGLPDPSPDHAQSLARVALRMRRYLERRNASHREQWLCRMGLHSGAVIGSIVGVQKYVYDIFGPGVNYAARLEALAEPMQILVSEDTYRLVRDQFTCSEAGEHDVKGFGRQRIYGLESEAQVR